MTPFRKNLIKRKIIPPLKSKRLIAIWSRTWMGLQCSPEHCVRYYYFIEEFVRGSQKEKDNPLRWDRIILNLMGSTSFNPSLPTVIKWDDKLNRMAGELVAYVDDLRGIGVSN